MTLGTPFEAKIHLHGRGGGLELVPWHLLVFIGVPLGTPFEAKIHLHGRGGGLGLVPWTLLVLIGCLRAPRLWPGSTSTGVEVDWGL